MTDLIDRLADLGRDPVAPTPTDAAARDLARGRSALRHRRARFGSAAAVVAFGVAGGAVALSTGARGARRAPDVAVGAPRTRTVVPPARSPQPLKVKLVDYTGQEPEGFHIGSIPQGYDLDLQAATPNEILIAPAGDTDGSPDSFVGKLVVTAESASELGDLPSLGTASVTVGGSPGRIGDDGAATQVWWQVGSTIIDVQCWDTIGLTHAQVVDFAGGVSMTSGIQLSHG